MQAPHCQSPAHINALQIDFEREDADACDGIDAIVIALHVLIIVQQLAVQIAYHWFAAIPGHQVHFHWSIIKVDALCWASEPQQVLSLHFVTQ